MCSLKTIYGKLSGDVHFFQSSPDAVDVVVGIVNTQEAAVLKCTLESHNIPWRMNYLRDAPSLALQRKEVKEEEEKGQVS